VAVLGGIVWFSINQANKGVVTVQDRESGEGGLAGFAVTASGEVKPTTYTNITRQGFGRITEILVKRADQSRRRPAAAARRTCKPTPMCELSRGNEFKRVWSTDAEAAYGAKADFDPAAAKPGESQLDSNRGQGLYKDGLIPSRISTQRKTT